MMPSRDELPIPDYDHLPVGSLAHRVRTLDADAIDVLLAYENEHAARRPVLDQLIARRDALRSGAAQPSGGDPAAPQPEQAPMPDGAATQAPSGDQAGTNQPLRHGVAGQTPNRQIRSR
jgi:hypothetical protein